MPINRLIAVFAALLLVPAPAFAQGTAKPKSSLNSEINSQFPDNAAGAITPQILRNVTQDMVASSQQYAGVNAQVGTSYTVQTSDYGQLVTFNNAAAIAVSLPSPATAGFTPFNFYVGVLGLGAVTITPTGGTINGAASLAVPTGNQVWIVSDGTNYQIFKGYSTPPAAVSTITPQHRISLASATPVMTASQAAKTTVYVTPDGGNIIPIFDGANFTATTFAETSQTTSDTTKSPAAVANNSVYDIFCWVDPVGPTNRCTRGPPWSNTTTRSAGTALVAVNGIWLNSVSITNGPAAQRGTYVGSICSDGSATINYVFGAASSGGTAANFCVWNAYNRRSTGTTVTDTGTFYDYASATIRQARASTGNQINFLLGLSEDSVWASYNGYGSPIASTSSRIDFGLCFNQTTAYSRQPVFIRNNSGTNTLSSAAGVSSQSLFGIGVNSVAACESNPAAAAGNGFNLGSFNSLEAILRN